LSHKDKKTILNRQLVPFLVLFVPQKSFEIYYILIIFIVSVDFFRNSREFSYKILFLFFYFSILVFTRSLFFIGLDDFKELFKVLFFLFVFNYIFLTTEKIVFKNLKIILLLFVSINLFVVLNQIFSFNNEIKALISDVFLGDSQRLLLTYNNVRAPGLSPGVGQQGVIFFILSMFFWYTSVNEKGLLNYFLFFCSSFILILSQSKTCFLAFLIFVSIQIVYLKNLLKYVFIPIFFFLIFSFYNKFLFFFREYNNLSNISSSSSLDARLNLWFNFLKPASEYPLSILTGIGRNYFSNFNLKTSVFDSDFIYVFVNFGFFGLIIFILFLVSLFKKFFKFKLFLFLGLLVGFTLNFFLEPKSFFLILILGNYLDNMKNEQEHLLDSY
jgi:hypothetical protein